MADAEAGCSSAAAGHIDGEDRYFRALTTSFERRHGKWKKEDHRPQTAAEYAESLDNSQTNTCTRLTALHYQRDMGVQLENITGMDSHMFSCKWVSPDDHRLCFHINFHASTVGEHTERSFFFAEVVGINCPQSVNTCVMMDMMNGYYSTKNCTFCSGMWHPVSGGLWATRASPPDRPGLEMFKWPAPRWTVQKPAILARPKPDSAQFSVALCAWVLLV